MIDVREPAGADEQHKFLLNARPPSGVVQVDRFEQRSASSADRKASIECFEAAPSTSKTVDRNLEVPNAVVLRWRQMTGPHVHLDGRQDQLRHIQLGVTRGTHGDELFFGYAIVYMNVARPLLGHRARPPCSPKHSGGRWVHNRAL